MAVLLIVLLRKYDKTQDFDGDEENSFSKNQPDKVNIFFLHFEQCYAQNRT